MKKFWEAIIVLTVIIGAYLLLWPHHVTINVSPAQNRPASIAGSNALISPENAPGAPRMANSASSNTVVPDQLAARAASPNSAVTGAETNALPDLPPLTALDKARVVIHNYHDAFGENPVGTNPEITAALKGKNPKQINFVENSGLRVNDQGEMVDGYGTPFFFHQISGQEMEIRSAGKDRTMWSPDDLVTR